MASIDILRGAVMVLMALDHVRVYAGIPAGGPTPGVFFTRWVTHFCAAVFVFLAGTSAFMAAQRMESKAELTRWLITRGAILVVLDVTLMRFLWTFNVGWLTFSPTNVLWAIGWSMIALGALVHLPLVATTIIGATIVFGHNALAPVLQSAAGPDAPALQRALLAILYNGGGFKLGADGPVIAVLYSLIPWIGVMALGYSFGAIMRLPSTSRDRICVALGTVAVVTFVTLRATGIYGDPRPWGQQAPPAVQRTRPPNQLGQPTAASNGPVATAPTAQPGSAPTGGPQRPPGGSADAPRRPTMHPALAFLNTAKYPASLLFLLMTIGPAILLIPWLERSRSRMGSWLTVFGRVPFFFYVMHIALIHVVAIAIAAVRTPQNVGWLFGNHPMAPPPVPEGYRWSLLFLYLVTAVVVLALYPACRWYMHRKATNPHPLMRFL